MNMYLTPLQEIISTLCATVLQKPAPVNLAVYCYHLDKIEVGTYNSDVVFILGLPKLMISHVRHFKII
jgi:hypothetical protein